jgi:hypothetical protein
MHKYKTSIIVTILSFFAHFASANLNLAFAMDKENQPPNTCTESLWDIHNLGLDKEKSTVRSELSIANKYGSNTCLEIESATKKYFCNILKSILWNFHILEKSQRTVVGSISVRLRPDKELPEENNYKMKKFLSKNGILHRAYLDYVEINPEHQGNKYCSDALRIFNKLMDGIGADYIQLELDSRTPYAGSIYHKAGYKFEQATANCIQATFGKNKDSQVAINEYLKDSSKPVKNCVGVMMIRYNPRLRIVL